MNFTHYNIYGGLIELIGFRIRELRKIKKLTQKQLAKKINVDCSTVTKWETGKANPDFEKQIFLANFFNVSVDYLLGRTEKNAIPIENDTPKDNVIVYCRNGETTQIQLSQDKMNLILKMLDAIKDDDDNL